MFSSKLIRGSFILLVAFGIFNVFNFAYQLVMARFLSVENYGILATLSSIIYIFAIFSESIQTVIVKYIVGAGKGEIRNILTRSLRKTRIWSTRVFVVYLIISILLTSLLGIPYWLLALNGLIVYFMFLLPVTRGVLQGRKQFVALGTNLVIESTLKLIISMVLVLIGWEVYGAIGGFLMGALFAFVASFIPLRDIYKTPEKFSKTENIYEYARPTGFITAIVVLFYSADVLIAKLVFAPEIAGAYAIASILGKAIFWISVPIGKAMFPLTAENNQEKNKDKIFMNAIAIVLLLALIVISGFYLFSNQIIYIFSGKNIPDASSILIYLGISFSIIALTNLILLYKLSLGYLKRYWIFAICNFIEIIVLFMASKNLQTFSIAFLIMSTVFLMIVLSFNRSNRHV